MFGGMGRVWTEKSGKILPRSSRAGYVYSELQLPMGRKGRKRREEWEMTGGVGDAGPLSECLEERCGSRLRKLVNLVARRKRKEMLSP